VTYTHLDTAEVHPDNSAGMKNGRLIDRHEVFSSESVNHSHQEFLLDADHNTGRRKGGGSNDSDAGLEIDDKFRFDVESQHISEFENRRSNIEKYLALYHERNSNGSVKRNSAKNKIYSTEPFVFDRENDDVTISMKNTVIPIGTKENSNTGDERYDMDGRTRSLLLEEIKRKLTNANTYAASLSAEEEFNDTETPSESFHEGGSSSETEQYNKSALNEKVIRKKLQKLSPGVKGLKRPDFNKSESSTIDAISFSKQKHNVIAPTKNMNTVASTSSKNISESDLRQPTYFESFSDSDVSTVTGESPTIRDYLPRGESGNESNTTSITSIEFGFWKIKPNK